MKTKLLRWNNWTVGVGTALIILGVWLFLDYPGWEATARSLVLNGVCLFLIGSCFYARGKGYPAAIGLLSLLFLGGLLILFLLPDRNADIKTD